MVGALSLLGDLEITLSKDKGQQLSPWAVLKGAWDQEKDRQYWVKHGNCGKSKIWRTTLFLITLIFPRWDYKDSLTVTPPYPNALHTFEGEL